MPVDNANINSSLLGRIMPDLSQLDKNEHISLCEALDRVLNKGAVVVGDLTISVANIDLIYLGLRVILSSIETARQAMTPIETERMELSNGPN